MSKRVQPVNESEVDPAVPRAVPDILRRGKSKETSASIRDDLVSGRISTSGERSRDLDAADAAGGRRIHARVSPVTQDYLLRLAAMLKRVKAPKADFSAGLTGAIEVLAELGDMIADDIPASALRSTKSARDLAGQMYDWMRKAPRG